MTQQSWKIVVLDKLARDEQFRLDFELNPRKAVEKLNLGLTEIELKAIESLTSDKEELKNGVQMARDIGSGVRYDNNC